MKNILIGTAIAGALVAAPIFYAKQSLETVTSDQITSLPFIENAEVVESKFNFENGNLILTHNVQDIYGGAWTVASVMEVDWGSKSIKSLSRSTPADQKTLEQNINLVNPTNSVLKAVALGEYSLDKQHIEVEVEPFLVQSQGSSLLLPSSLFILDDEKGKSTATFAFLDPVQINHLGQITSMRNLRAQYSNSSNLDGQLLVKLDSLKVGDLTIVDDATIAFNVNSESGKDDAKLSISANETPFFDALNINIGLNNLVDGELVTLTKYASDYAMASDPLLASNAKLGLLKHAITFAQNQGEMTVDAKALTKKTQESIEISSSLGYSESSAALISEDNALSLMHYAKASLTFSAPTWQTDAMLPPEWLMAAQAFLVSDGKRYTTQIDVEDMDAMVNGTPLAL